jgi:hypothetical protein
LLIRLLTAFAKLASASRLNDTIKFVKAAGASIQQPEAALRLLVRYPAKPLSDAIW